MSCLNESQSIDSLFAIAVTALTSATEPWPMLTYLAKASPPKTHRSSRPEAGHSQPADEAIEKVQLLSDAVRSASLFSRNEQLDEIPTSHVKFLLTPYLHALSLQAWQGDAPQRAEKLESCDAELQTFFTDVDNYGLLTESQRDCVLLNSPDLIETPQQKRDSKIARFRMEKAAESRLQLLMELMEKRGTSDDVEAELREASLVLLESAVRRALNLVSSLSQERDILRFAQRQRKKGMDPSAVARQARPKGPPPGMRGLPPTFRIVNEREKERDGVFRAGHSLPTYTVEEWGEIEAERMIKEEMEKKEKEIVAKRQKEEEDSDGDDVADRETMEARRWDNWKDDHNKGSGNTIR